VFRTQLPVYSPLSAKAVLAAFGTGDRRREVRELLAARFTDREIVLTDSGTNALQLAIKHALALRPGLACALPAFGCYDLATAAIGADAPVVMYDVDPRTLRPDSASLRRCVEAGVAAVVVVHYFGIPTPLGEISELVRRTGALLIEDAAQGFGGGQGGRFLGGSGDLGILSFGRGKGVTGGRGGALLSRAALATEMPIIDTDRGLADRALDDLKLVAQFTLSRPALYGIPSRIPALGLGETRFHPPSSPKTMFRSAARVLEVSLGRSDEEVVARRANVERILRAVGASRSVPRPEVGSAPSWLRLPVLGPEHTHPVRRECATLGIVPSYPRTLDTLPELRARLKNSESFVGATELASTLWTVPTHSRLVEQDIQRLASWIGEYGR
jgi:dTDP-4-amino-4,6-dideoxygalactose transaminase